MPSTFNLRNEDDAQLQSFFGEALTEQKEATDAFSSFTAIAQQKTQEEIVALRELSQQQSSSAAAAAADLDQIQTASQKLHEQRTSIFANQLEPLMQLINPDESIMGLSSALETARTSLSVTQARGALADQSYKTGAAARAKEIENARLLAAGEQGDVDAIKSTINLIQGRQDARTRTAARVSRTASVAQMQDAVKSGLISRAEMTREIQSRTSSSLSIKSAMRQDFLQGLETQSVEQLEEFAKANPKHRETVSGVIRRKQSNVLTFEVSKQAALLALFETKSPAEVVKGVENGTLSKGQGRRILESQESAQIAHHDLVESVKDKDQARVQVRKKAYLRDAPLHVLEAMETEAAKNGGVANIPGVDGVTVSITELQPLIKGKSTAIIDQTLTKVATQTAQQQIASTSRTMAMANGQPFNETDDPVSIYSAIANDPTMPESLRNRTNGALSLLKNIKQTDADETIEIAMNAASKELAAVDEQLRAIKANGMTPARAKAYQQMVAQNGIINSNPLALGAIGESLQEPIFDTGNTIYNAGMSTLKAFAAQVGQTGPTPGGRETSKAQNLIAQDDLKKKLAKDPTLAMRLVLDTPGVVQAITETMAGEWRQDLYRHVWSAAGDEQMLAMLSNFRSDLYSQADNGSPQLSEANIAAFYLKNRGPGMQNNWENFQKSARALAPQALKRLQPVGNDAVVMAAINEAIFKNHQGPVLMNSLNAAFGQAQHIALSNMEQATPGPVRVGSSTADFQRDIDQLRQRKTDVARRRINSSTQELHNRSVRATEEAMPHIDNAITSGQSLLQNTITSGHSLLRNQALYSDDVKKHVSNNSIYPEFLRNLFGQE